MVLWNYVSASFCKVIGLYSLSYAFSFPIYNYVLNNISLCHSTFTCILFNFSFYLVVDPRKYVSVSKSFQVNWFVVFLLCLFNFPYTIMSEPIFHCVFCFTCVLQPISLVMCRKTMTPSTLASESIAALGTPRLGLPRIAC